MALSRRGIELPVSMLVILIVSIIMLGLAGGITYKIVCGSETAIATADAQTQKSVERQLATGPAVIVPDSTKSATQPSSLCGSGGKLGAVYTLGIRNDNDVATDFKIACADNNIDNVQSDCADVQFFDTVHIEPGQRATSLVSVNVNSGTKTGRNVYTLHVEGGSIDKRVNIYLDVN